MNPSSNPRPSTSVPGDDLRDLSVTRLSLVNSLRDWEDQSGWRRFFDVYGHLLFLWSIKAGLSEPEAQEAVQETVLSVAKAMRDEMFERRGKGSFKAWLYGVARNRISDQFRRRRDREISSETIETMSEPRDGELERLWDAEWASHRLRRAASLTRERVSAQQFQIFDLYVLREWSVDEVRKTLNVSRPQIYMAKLRIGAVFKEMLEQTEDDL
ncbi:MAG: sigma-70 family RNA polymerase sigma factor [Verrucomicrobiales bacterium]